MWWLGFMYSYYSSELQYRPTRMHSLTKCHPNLSYPWTQGTTGSQLFHPICPCRMCKIQAIRDITGGGTTYYVPLCQPHQHGLPASSWDLIHLPYSEQECYQVERKKKERDHPLKIE